MSESDEAKKIRPKRSAGNAGKQGKPDGSAVGGDTRSRRDVLATLRNWGLIGVVAAAGGWYLVGEVRATIAEQDLSRIGNGIPAIVQIHDPQCSRCLALQRETREALAEFDDGELQYLVANIRHAKGQKLAAAHGVRHITLLLFDGAGKRRSILSGPNTSANLVRSFRSFLSNHGGGA